MSKHEYRSNQEKNAQKAKRNRALVELAKAGGCVDCGLDEPDILEFDHVPERGEKLRDIGPMVASGAGVAVLLAELAKCDVVCPNCHRRRTNVRRQFGRTC